ncbi:MAG: MFS transporter [Anaerolineae bacterium]|nr:MFS transporter [Anaerolineae bacterium]
MNLAISSHPLIKTLRSLNGNARGAVLTEALWGIPFSLYAPYISVYMLAFGLTDSQIGLITSIGLAGQIFFSLLSGAITDKMGRKRTTLIFDLISWSIPTLIWAVAQNFNYFVIAAIINSTWRITHNSWSCVLVEDTDPDLLVDIYAWIYIAGQLSVFFAPLAGVLINRFSLIPTMRGLYLFACLMMTIKFLAMNAMVTETRQGVVRMQETKGQNLFALLGEYSGVFRQILAAPQTLFTLGIMLVMSIVSMVNGTFWAILVTEKLRIPAEHLALYPFAKSVVMLIFFFIIIPRIRDLPFRNPMLVGFAAFIAAQALLISLSEKNYILLLLSVIIETCAYSVVGTQIDRMLVVTVDAAERARIMSILLVIQVAATTPFGWIAGELSTVNRILPFMLNIALLAVGALLVYLAARLKKPGATAAGTPPANP